MNNEEIFPKSTHLSLVIVTMLLHGCAPNVDLAKNSYAISRIKNLTEKQQLIAVSAKGGVLEYIDNPSEKVQLAALNNDPRAMRYIAKPTEQMQLIAIQRHQEIHPHGTPRSLAYKHPICRVLDDGESAQLLAIKYEGHLIKCIDNPTEKTQLYILENDPSLIKDIKNISIKNHPKFLVYKSEQRISKLKKERERKEEEKRWREHSYSSSRSTSSSSSSNYSAPQKTCQNVARFRTVRVMGGRPGQTTQERYYEEVCN